MLRHIGLAGTAPEGPWPGTMAEARKLAAKLRRPRLIDALAGIILERASVAWTLSVRS
ncbi:MAG: hypothetical protein ABW133_08610 [Polyangiaceae bacterium]